MYYKVLYVSYICSVINQVILKMVLEKDRNTAIITHLSGFGSSFFPLGSILFPIIIRETKKNDSQFFDKLTKDVVNFNLSYLLYTFLIKLLIIPISIASLFEHTFINQIHFNTNNFFEGDFGNLLSILLFVKAILIIKAAIKSHQGEIYEYPYIIRFIK